MRDETCFDLQSAIDRLQAKNEELKHYCERLKDENSKLGLQYEQLLKDKSDLDRKLGFLEGQIEAYQYCMNCRR